MLILLFLSCGKLWAADEHVEPCLVEPQKTGTILNDSARVNLLNHRAMQLVKDDPAGALKMAENARALGESVNYQQGIIQSLTILARANQGLKEYVKALDFYLQASTLQESTGQLDNLYQLQSEIGQLFVGWGVHEKAVEYYENAYGLSKQLRDTTMQVQVLNYLGDTYLHLNNKEKAQSYYMSLLKLQKSLDQKREVLSVLEKLAEIYAEMGAREKALEYELQILSVKKELSIKSGLASSLNKIGRLYKNLNQNQLALRYFKESLKLTSDQREDAQGSQNDDILMNIAFIYQAEGDYHEALKYLFDALEIRRNREDFVTASEVNHEISYTYLALGKLKPAKEYAEMAVTWGEREKAYDVLVKSYKIMSDIYLRDGDDKKALKFYKKHTEIMRQLYMAQNKQKQQLLEKQLQIERQEKGFKLLSVDKEIKELELQQLQFIADKKESDITLLKKEKEIQDISILVQQAEKEQAQQALLLSEQAYEAEKNNREMRIQALRLKQKELEEKERQKTIALLKERKALQESELEISQAMRSFFFGLSVLFAIILFLIYRSYRLKKKANTSLALQNMEIQQQKDRLEEALKELKAAHTQIVQSEKMASLGELTAGIAHEINNPINFVYAGVDGLRVSLEGLLEVLNKYAELDRSGNIKEIQKVLYEVQDIKEQLFFEETKDSVFQVVNAIKEGASRTAEIVKGLRSFSRLDETELKKAHIHEGIDSTLILLKSKIADSRVQIEKHYDPLMPEIECFPGQLNQVFMNIIGNAIDAIDGDGRVAIHTKNMLTDVQIKIVDNGKGMSEEIKSKIFQPFFTTKGPGEGTGLGLSITFGIIDKHHGKIKVDSTMGKGTIFTITIPKRLQNVMEPVMS